MVIINNVVHGGQTYDVPAHLSYGQYVIDKLRENCVNGNEIALINGDNGEQFTFKQILYEIICIATGLKKLGVKRGDIIALCSENRLEYIGTAVGAACCGVAVTTISTQYTSDELIHALNLSKPKIIFCSGVVLQNKLDTLKSLSYIEKIVQFDKTFVEKSILLYSDLLVKNVNVEEYEADPIVGQIDTLFILYSSGTTGLPKGVMLTHLNALYLAHHFKKEENRYTKKILTIVPWYHAYGLLGTINNTIHNNLQIYLYGFNPQRYLSAIQEYEINVLLAVPPIVVFLGKSPLAEKHDLSSITVVWCAAAPLRQHTINDALKRLPNCKSILQAYGMTETTTVATKDLEDDNAKRKTGSGGIPIDGIKAKVVNIETREKLGPYQEGEICIKGPTIMKGYVGDDAATREIIDEEGYIKTGDIGYYDEDGYFFVVDRLKELIKYKGFQVAPAEVENVILQHPGVADCGVVGAPDETAGELTTAFVVKKPGVHVTAKDIIEFANSKMSSPKHLRGGVIFLNSIPRNPSGKILRRVLRQNLQLKSQSKL